MLCLLPGVHSTECPEGDAFANIILTLSLYMYVCVCVHKHTHTQQPKAYHGAKRMILELYPA